MKLLTDITNLKSKDLVSLECEICKNEFKRQKHDVQKVLKGSYNLTLAYCSNACSSLAKRKTVHTQCGQCSRPITTVPCRIKKTKKGLSFCDMTCAAIYNNENRKLSRPNKTVYRSTAFKHLPNKCSVCGYDAYLSVLEVHHKDKNRTNNSIDNLEILCPTHHSEKHFLDKSGQFNNLK